MSTLVIDIQLLIYIYISFCLFLDKEINLCNLIYKSSQEAFSVENKAKSSTSQLSGRRK